MNSKPLIIAHRGASAHFPENTLPAFECALERFQVEMMEFDVQMTKDGIPVILHDSRLDRTTNGSGYLSHTTLEEIKQLDAGFYFDPDGDKQFPERGKGITIPTFDELLDITKSSELAIEIKQPSPELLEVIIRKLQERGILEKAIIGSKYDVIRQKLDRAYPEIRRFSSRTEVIGLLLEFMRTKSPAKARPGVTVSIPTQSFGVPLDSSNWIDFLHKKGMNVFYWTIDEPEEMLKLANHSADGIVTNNVEKAKEVLA